MVAWAGDESELSICPLRQFSYLRNFLTVTVIAIIIVVEEIKQIFYCLEIREPYLLKIRSMLIYREWRKLLLWY
jgi:hypothetical protein